MKADTSSRFLLTTPAGMITIVSMLGVIGYLVWIFSGRYDPDLDSIISSSFLTIYNLLVFILGLVVVLNRRYNRKLRWGWSMLAVGALCFAIAEGLWMFYQHVLDTEPFPSPADVFYTLYYPLTLIGVLIFTIVFVRQNERRILWLDLAIVMTFMVMVAWYHFLDSPLFFGDRTLETTLLLFYPMGDLVILAAIIALIQRELSLVARKILTFTALSMLCALVGDILFAYYEIRGDDYIMAYLNVTWICASVAQMLATAQLLAAGPGLLNDTSARYSSIGTLLRLAIPYLAILIGLALLAVAIHTDPVPDAHLLGLLYGSFALVALVMVRQYLILKENVRLAQSMRRIAWTDSLTGVYSRHFFNEMLPREMERAARYKFQLSLLLLDIDGFKKYNDTYGHLKGDYVLRSLAQVFSTQIRSSDIVARFGGDEFVVILPETSRRTAMVIAERITRAVAAQSFDGVNLAVSIGVTAFHTGLTPEQLVEVADQDMYRRKNSARTTKELKRQSAPLSAISVPSDEAHSDARSPLGLEASESPFQPGRL